MRRWLSLSLSLSLSIAAFLSGSFIHRFIMALRQTLFFFCISWFFASNKKRPRNRPAALCASWPFLFFGPRSLVSLLFLFCFCFCFSQWLICRRRCRIDFEIAFAATTTTEPYGHHRRTETRNWDSYFDYRRRIDYRLKRLD